MEFEGDDDDDDDDMFDLLDAPRKDRTNQYATAAAGWYNCQ